MPPITAPEVISLRLLRLLYSLYVICGLSRGDPSPHLWMPRRPFSAYTHNVAELTAVDHIYRRSQLVTCLRSHTYPTPTQARQSGVEHGVDAVYRNALEPCRPYRVSVQWCVTQPPPSSIAST